MSICKEWTLTVVPTSQRTQFASILKSYQLDIYGNNGYLFREFVTHKYSVCGRMQNFLML